MVTSHGCKCTVILSVALITVILSYSPSCDFPCSYGLFAVPVSLDRGIHVCFHSLSIIIAINIAQRATLGTREHGSSRGRLPYLIMQPSGAWWENKDFLLGMKTEEIPVQLSKVIFKKEKMGHSKNCVKILTYLKTLDSKRRYWSKDNSNERENTLDIKTRSCWIEGIGHLLSCWSVLMLSIWHKTLCNTHKKN